MTRTPLPAHLVPYWSRRVDDPRDAPNYCARQSRKTPAIPWHNGYPVCLACGRDLRTRVGRAVHRFRPCTVCGRSPDVHNTNRGRDYIGHPYA